MYSYTKYFISVLDETSGKMVSDLIGGEFSQMEAVNKFMQIHFPANKAYLPFNEEPARSLNGVWYSVLSIDTDIGSINTLGVMFRE